MRVYYGKAVYGKEEIAATLDVLKNKSINLSGDIHLVEDGWNYDNSKGLSAEIQIRKYANGRIRSIRWTIQFG